MFIEVNTPDYSNDKDLDKTFLKRLININHIVYVESIWDKYANAKIHLILASSGSYEHVQLAVVETYEEILAKINAG